MRKCLILLGIAAAVSVGACSSMSTTSSDAEKRKPISSAERARKLVEIANGALVEGDPTGALANLMQAEHEDATLPELHHSKALVFFVKKDLPAAILCARKAVELKPDYSDANNTLGKLLMDQGQVTEAILYLTLAANDPIYRQAFKALTSLGIVEYRRGKFKKAEDHLTRAINASADGACVAYYYRGHLRMRDSRLPEAIKDYQSAGKKTCAAFADAQFALGMAYEQNKQFDQARKKYLEIQTQFPNTEVAEKAVTHLRFLP